MEQIKIDMANKVLLFVAWIKGLGTLMPKSIRKALPAFSNDLNAPVVQAVDRGIQIADKGVGCDACAGLAANPRSSALERAAATAQGTGLGDGRQEGREGDRTGSCGR